MYTELLWAKTNPRKSLLHHSIDTGMMCQALLQNSGGLSLWRTTAERARAEHFGALAVFLCAIHDIGKAHPYFQAKAPDDPITLELYRLQMLSVREHGKINDYRHESGGRWILSRILSTMSHLPRATRKALCYAVQLHHQHAAKQDEQQSRIPKQYGDFWTREQDALFTALHTLFPVVIDEACVVSHMDADMTMLYGLIILSDWLASGQAAFQAINEGLPVQAYCQVSREAALLALKDAELYFQPISTIMDFAGMFSYIPIPQAAIRPLQRACERLAQGWHVAHAAPGLIILEAPMGEGKTEAALFLAEHLMRAHGKQGFYVALPTGATSNAMYERINAFLSHHGSAGARLVHAQAWVVTQEAVADHATESYADASSWLAPSRRALLSQYAVGTVDQVMMAALQMRYGVLRLMGIASKVLIIDEVHAYDAYMLRIIEELLEWCAALNVPVVLLSATLPSERRTRLLRAYGGKVERDSHPEQGYPLISQVYSDGKVAMQAVNGTAMRMTVRVEPMEDPDDWDIIADLAIRRVQSGGCLCVLLNTVREAQALYTALSERVAVLDDAPHVDLFHARFPLEDRARLERAFTAMYGKHGTRPEKAILVATQVCEQSLDLDFDDMLTYLCPVDLLLQRIGRLHRHTRTRPRALSFPRVTVIIPPMEALDQTATARVYSPWILRKTAHAISRLQSINLPDDIRPLIEAVYDAKPDPNDHDYTQWAEMAFGDLVKSEAARKALLPSPSADMFSIMESTNEFYDEEPEWLDPFAKDSNASHSQESVTARTRMGLGGVRVALLEEPLFHAAIAHPDRNTARRVLMRSLSVPAYWFDAGAPAPSARAVKGDGLLRGFWLLLTTDGSYVYNQCGNRRRYYVSLNNRLGVVRTEEQNE